MTDTPETEDVAVVHLSSDEAVVLFELLSRWSSADEGPAPAKDCFESTAECAVLHSVLADLERQLGAPFKTDYEEIVKEARQRLAPGWTYPTLSG